MINSNEHVFVAGMTQSGKTYLMKKYLMNVEVPVFVLATKGVFEWKEIPKKLQVRVHKFDDLVKIKIVPGIKIIYEPIFEELNVDYYNEFFKYCYQLRNNIIVVDEAMQVAPSSKSLPLWYKGVLTRGMELNVGCWSLSQRPANIPIQIITESTHYFIFKLNAISDRKRLVDYTGYKEFLTIPKTYNFWYFNTIEGGKPILAKLKK